MLSIQLSERKDCSSLGDPPFPPPVPTCYEPQLPHMASVRTLPGRTQWCLVVKHSRMLLQRDVSLRANASPARALAPRITDKNCSTSGATASTCVEPTPQHRRIRAPFPKKPWRYPCIWVYAQNVNVNVQDFKANLKCTLPSWQLP